MSQFLKKVVAKGLHGRFDIDISLNKDINIIHGVNGVGKTTLLHILANATNLDLDRFTFLWFREIELEISGGPSIQFIGKPSSHQDEHPRSDVWLRIDSKCVKEAKAENVPNFDIETDSRRSDVYLRRQLQAMEEIKEINHIDIESTYFPAFRTMIEAWSSSDLPPSTRRFRSDPRGLLRVRETELARTVFGGFVPRLSYPSPREIQIRLNHALQNAVSVMATQERNLLSDAFKGVFEAISSDTLDSDTAGSRDADTLRDSIRDLFDELQSTQNEYGLTGGSSAIDALGERFVGPRRSGEEELRTRILEVYEQQLKIRHQALLEAFEPIRKYIDSVNKFLDGKELVTEIGRQNRRYRPYARRYFLPQLWIKHDDDEELASLDTLSSGERQVVGLLYAASRENIGNIVLVDEPELSLHIDWQSEIINAMKNQLPSKQLIVCTHSPVIASDYLDEMIELKRIPTKLLISPLSGEIDMDDISDFSDEESIYLDDEGIL